MTIVVDDLTKRYGAKVAVAHLSFTVSPGVVTGFLGPNGSGKSTSMRCMLGLDRPGTYPVVPIDSLRLERCDLIKMDVEGVQVQAMQGSAETLARCKPLLWVELREKHGEFEAGNAKMQSLGYRVVRKVAGSANDYLFGPA